MLKWIHYHYRGKNQVIKCNGRTVKCKYDILNLLTEQKKPLHRDTYYYNTRKIIPMIIHMLLKYET